MTRGADEVGHSKNNDNKEYVYRRDAVKTILVSFKKIPTQSSNRIIFSTTNFNNLLSSALL